MLSSLTTMLAITPTEIALIVVLPFVLAAGALIGMLINKKLVEKRIGDSKTEASRLLEDARLEAKAMRKEALLEAKEEQLRLRNEFEKESKQRRIELRNKKRDLIRRKMRSTKREHLRP